MENIKKKSFKAFAWDFLGKIAGQSAGFFISIFLARILSPSDFGLLAMVNVVVTVASSLLDMGLGSALIQRTHVTEEQYGSVFFFNVGVGTILAISLFLSADVVASFYGDAKLVLITKVMSLSFVLSSIGNVIRLKLQRDLEYAVPVTATLIGAISSGVLGVVAASFHMGVWSLVIQSLSSYVLADIYLFWRVKWRPKLVLRWRTLKELWQFGFKMFLANILDITYQSLDSLIIGKIFSPAMLGYYYRGKSFNNYVTQYSSGSLVSVLFPAFSKIKSNREQFSRAVDRALNIIAFLAFFLNGLFYIIGDELILVLFGEKWRPSIPLFRLIVLNAYNLPIYSFVISILKSQGHSQKYLKIEIVKKSILALSFIFGFYWGINGFLILNVFGYLLSLIYAMMVAAKESEQAPTFFVKKLIPYLLITSSAVLATYLSVKFLPIGDHMTLVLEGLVFCLLFISLAKFFRLPGLEIIITEIRAAGVLKEYYSKFRNRLGLRNNYGDSKNGKTLD